MRWERSPLTRPRALGKELTPIHGRLYPKKKVLQVPEKEILVPTFGMLKGSEHFLCMVDKTVVLSVKPTNSESKGKSLDLQ